MIAFLLYALKSAICLVLFYLLYKVLLANETFFRFNRYVLLVGSIVCFVLPLIKTPVQTHPIVRSPIVLVEEILMHSEQKGERLVTETEYSTEDKEEITASKTPSLPSTLTIIGFVFLSGCLINLFFVLRSYLSMTRIIKNADKREYKGYKLILTEEDTSPFSWHKYIVLSKEDYKNNSEEILTHETAHIRAGHSFDLILFELLILLQWFNPAMWLLRKELNDIHEYEADTAVLQSGINATRYQLLLVKKAVGSSSYTLANSFNHSKIKKRITMMLKERSNQWARLKLLLLLPAGLIALQMNARNIESTSNEPTVINSETSMPLSGKSTESNSENQEKIEYYIISIDGMTLEKDKDQHWIAIIADVEGNKDGIRMTPEEYKAFFKNVKTTDSAEDFTKGEKITLTMSSCYYLKDGKPQKTETHYHLLTKEQKAELLTKVRKTIQKDTPPPPPPQKSQRVVTAVTVEDKPNIISKKESR